MGIIKFPKRRHVRASASSRAASAIIFSAVRPDLRATAVPRIEAHHSDGILSRRRHLETIEYVAPMSDTAASMEGHRSITALNEIGFDIESCLGQIGLDGKANVADDCDGAGVDNPAMVDRMSETEEKLAFIRRVKQARMARFATQKPICTILGIDQGVYKHYETRSPLPYRFIPKFIAATGVEYEWLLTGDGQGPVTVAIPAAPRRRRTPRQKAA